MIVTYETIRQWSLKFGEDYANTIRSLQPKREDKWHLDEVVLTIKGQHLRGEVFFEYWCELVERSGLQQMIKIKELMVRHASNMLNSFKHKVSNAVSEAINRKIQLLKASARGFRSFESYRIRILFYCRKLEMHSANSRKKKQSRLDLFAQELNYKQAISISKSSPITTSHYLQIPIICFQKNLI
ncbi:MAG: transposase [Chlorobiaceae bacterium]